MHRFAAPLFALVVLAGQPALSATFFVVPPGTATSLTPDGTEAMPFPSVGSALASGRVKGGDTILLKDGNYGRLEIQADAAFDTPVVIMSQNGKAARFDSILLSQRTRNLTLRNLSVWPSDPINGEPYLVRSYDGATNITIEGFDIRGDEAAANFMSWDAAKWRKIYLAIVLDGVGHVVRGNTITGVYEGITTGNQSQILYNSINGFDGDGMHAGNDSLVRGNRVTNCVAVSDNHDDGFQSFSSGGVPVSGQVLDANTIIEWTGPKDHPLRCNLQGIGLFGGPYQSMTITNNVIAVSHSHGISIFGVNGATISNNTIVNINGVAGTVPYLTIQPYADGSPSKNVLAANNLAMSIQAVASTTNNIVFRNNALIGVPGDVFQDPMTFDFTPKAASGWIDTGSSVDAPLVDVRGLPRPSGASADKGAYEMQAGGVTTPPTDTSGGTTTDTSGGTTTGTTDTTGGTTSGNSTGPKRLKPPKWK